MSENNMKRKKSKSTRAEGDKESRARSSERVAPSAEKRVDTIEEWKEQGRRRHWHVDGPKCANPGCELHESEHWFEYDIWRPHKFKHPKKEATDGHA
jgi:hypothetical protein